MSRTPSPYNAWAARENRDAGRDSLCPLDLDEDHTACACCGEVTQVRALTPDGLCPTCDARAQAEEDAEIERREREAEWSAIYGDDDKPRPGRF